MKLKKQIKTDRQKEQDKKGKDRMSYYLRKKLEREQKEAAPVEQPKVEETSTEGLSWYQRKKLKEKQSSLPPPETPGIRYLACWQRKGKDDEWKQIFLPMKDA